MENGGDPSPAGSPGLPGKWGCPFQQPWSLPEPTLLCRCHPSLQLGEFRSQSSWELLSVLSHKKQAPEQGFPRLSQPEAFEVCLGCPQSSTRLCIAGQAPGGGGRVGGVQ